MRPLYRQGSTLLPTARGSATGAAGQGMRFVDERLEPRLLNVRVDLRGADVRVPEQLLDAAQIRAVRQHMARERMAQDVRRHATGFEARGDRDLLQQLAEADAGQVAGA